MTITLPSSLTGLMSQIGYEFPTADEDKIAELGTAWTDLAGKLAPYAQQASDTASSVWGTNHGKDIDAFKTWWEAEDSPQKSLQEAITGAKVAGQALQTCALIVIGLKLYIIAELTSAAAAIAAAIAVAIETGGLGALAILGIKKVLKEAVGWAIEQAVMKVLEG